MAPNLHIIIEFYFVFIHFFPREYFDTTPPEWRRKISADIASILNGIIYEQRKKFGLVRAANVLNICNSNGKFSMVHYSGMCKYILLTMTTVR